MQNNEIISQQELVKTINEVSFSINDMQLYLDTHPTDQRALEDMRMLMGKRRKYLEIHTRYYGPLTMDTAMDNCSDSWAWILQPWPWEIQKGRC